MPRRLLALLFSLALAACNYAATPQPDGAVLFQDDFTLSISGWDSKALPASSVGYRDGSYRVQVHEAGTLVWGRPHLSFDDVTIDVETTKVAGPDDNLFGVICRFHDPANFTFFAISSDGFAGAGRYQDGERTVFNGAAMLPSSAVLPGEATNHLQVACLRTTVRMLVNGQLVAEASVPDSPPGDIGLLAGSYAEGGVDIRFDQLVVRQSKPAPGP
jgi:hypothetical protein